MLQIKNFSVEIDRKKIIKDIALDFSVKQGKLFVLFGPNGSGKSTILKGVMGFSKYKTSGEIILNGKNINELSIDQRANKGLAYMYQNPPKLNGVTLNDISKEITEIDNTQDIQELSIQSLQDRDINMGVSGGEIKRTELYTLSLLKNSKVFLFDEPDSGVDVDNLKVVAKYIKKLLKKNKAIGVIITHNGEILKYLDAQKAAVIYRGKVACEGEPKKIWECIKRDGYKSCINCNGGKI